MAANNMYILAANDESDVMKFRVLSVTITTTTTTTRTTTTTTRTSTTTTTTTSSTTTFAVSATTTEIGPDADKPGPVVFGLPDITILVIAGSGAVLVLGLCVIFLVFVVFRRKRPKYDRRQLSAHAAYGMPGFQRPMRAIRGENYPPQMHVDGNGIPMRQFRR